MAIVFNKVKPTNEILNGFNNEVIEFTSDSANTEQLATLVISGVGSFQLTPINGVFTFNLKEVMMYVAKNEKFADTSVLDLSNFVDGEFIKNIAIDFTIAFVEAVADETISRTFYFYRSVLQIGEERTQLRDNYSIANYNSLTFFKGYPFDVSINTGLTANTTVTNDIGITFTRSNFEDTRFYISDGLNFATDISLNPIITEGYNTLTFDGLTDSDTLNTKLIDACGVYLKYINEFGTWSYWLFNPIYRQRTQVQDRDVFMIDEVDISEAVGAFLTTGRDGANELNLITERLDENEQKQVFSILTSPRVELYTGDKGVSYADYSKKWQTVLVSNGTYERLNTKRNLMNLKLTITKNLYTQ